MIKFQVFYLIFVISIFLNLTYASGVSKLEVFVIPHSHCDPGWLMPAAEYFRVDVAPILTNVFNQLLNRPFRKFVWSETSYFQWWYDEQDSSVQDAFKKMVESGQIEFVGGGWVQNDEACASYTSMIDQMSLGHQYLVEKFGVRPRIGWQIDPFGHSAVVPRLFADMGFDALVLNRVHHKIKSKMRDNKELEFLWKLSDKGADGSSKVWSMFSHVLHTHYSAPQNYDFENPGVPPITSNSVYNRASGLVQDIKSRAKSYRTNHVLIPFGDDFKFKNAEAQFSNMDQLISHINSKPEYGMNIRYATLTDYFDSLHKATTYDNNITFPVYWDKDFFPYADNEDSYWTGYYSTKPALKRLSRMTEASLNAADASFVLAKAINDAKVKDNPVKAEDDVNRWREYVESLTRARQEVAITQHHDGITGTSRKHVLTDYENRLNNAIRDTESIQKHSLSIILDKNTPPVLNILSEKWETGIYKTTNVINEIVIFNSESYSRSQFVCLESSKSNIWVSTTADYSLNKESDTALVSSQVIPSSSSEPTYELCFIANVPGLGATTYFIKSNAETSNLDSENIIYGPSVTNLPKSITKTADEKELYIENSIYRISFDLITGMMKEVYDRRTGVTHDIAQNFLEYHTSRSGSYIFRSEAEPQHLGDQALHNLFISRGKAMQRAVIKTKRLTITVSLIIDEENNNLDPKAVENIHLLHLIEPLHANTEVVTRLFRAKESEAKRAGFYTFSGLGFQKRNLAEMEKAPTKAARFFPASAGTVLVDNIQNIQYAVVNDHTIGSTVVADSNSAYLELMLHRRLESDDGRGMSEGNQDHSPSRVSFCISIHSSTKPISTVLERPMIHKLSRIVNHPLRLFSSDEDQQSYADNHHLYFAPLQKSNDDLHLVYLQSSDVGNDATLRIQSVMDKPVTLDLVRDIFNSPLAIASVREKSLNLLVDVPSNGLDSLRLSFNPGQIVQFSYTMHSGGPTGPGVSQNTEESGVFLSDAALGLAAKNKQQDREQQQREPASAAPEKIPEHIPERPTPGNYNPLLNNRNLKSLSSGSISAQVRVLPYSIRTFSIYLLLDLDGTMIYKPQTDGEEKQVEQQKPKEEQPINDNEEKLVPPVQEEQQQQPIIENKPNEEKRPKISKPNIQPEIVTTKPVEFSGMLYFALMLTVIPILFIFFIYVRRRNNTIMNSIGKAMKNAVSDGNTKDTYSSLKQV